MIVKKLKTGITSSSEPVSSPGDSVSDASPRLGHPSLEGIHGTIAVPGPKTGFWRQWRAFVGPAVLVSVGYMGSRRIVGTDLQWRCSWQIWTAVGGWCGEPHGHFHASHLGAPRCGGRQGPGPMLPRLVSQLDPLAQLVAKKLNLPSARATSRKCSAAPSPSTCSSTFPCSGPSSSPDWMCCCCSPCNGSACALSKPSCLLHSRHYCAVLLRQKGCNSCSPQTQTGFLEMGRALVTPGFRQLGMVYARHRHHRLATVMPHNLYLHSALRANPQTAKGQKPPCARPIRFNTIDSTVALTIAFFVNDTAILVLAAMVFFPAQI